MRRSVLLTAVAVAAVTALPAAPAEAAFCYPLPTGHCISPCDVNNAAWETVENATGDAVSGPRCLN